MMATRADQVAEPKHEIFLSHSGAQKDFVHQLYVDLKRVSYEPFFDRSHVSLEKGATFPDHIFDAIRKCRLFVVVLSEDFFTRTKWPMMELAAAVAAQTENHNLKLLPLFFKISVPEFKAEERRANWFKCWTDWASQTSRIDVTKWEEALKVVEVWTGIPFPAGMGEVAYRKVIVETVCRICPNSVFDVSGVVGRERFCQIVSDKFDKLKGETQCGLKAFRIGLFGMGGLGKTTLCKVMCNHYFREFGGNVIHINLRLNTCVEQQKKVIAKLTGATQDELSRISDSDEGHLRLKNILSMHKVFLALDNVTDAPGILEEVLWYLSVSYGVGSMILVTSRSLEVLLSELQIAKNYCLEVPYLNETEAISLFLQADIPNKHLELSSYSDDEQLRVVEGVQMALFPRKLRQEQFHPLALKALAAKLGKLIDKPEQWRKTLQNLDLKKTQHKDHPIFSILGSSFEMLPEEEKLIFMDVALFKPSCAIVEEDICKWLCLVHGLTYKDIEEHLRSLRTKSLLEEGLGDEETKPLNTDEGATTSIGGLQEMEMYSGFEVVVHDLYVEFAKLECKSGSLDKIECFAHEDCNDVPRQMQGVPSGGASWPLKRMSLIRGRLTSLGECRFGEYYKNVVVLKLEYLTALIDLNMEGMFYLASVDILCCYELRNIQGLQTLKRLAWLRVARCEKLEVFPNLQDLRLLEHVEVRNTSKELCPIISNCPQLSELRLSGHIAVKDLSNIEALDALRKVMIEWCPKLCTLPKLQGFSRLHELHVLDCPELGGVMEIGGLVALKKLHLRWINISELGGVGSMRDLCHLICEHCPVLRKLSDKIGALTKLTLLRLSNCRQVDGVLAVGSLLGLQKLHLTDIAITKLEGVGKLSCLCELVWHSNTIRIPKLSCHWGELTELRKLRQLCIQDDCKSFGIEDFRPLERMRNFLQGEVHCDIGDVNHVMEIMTQQAIVVADEQQVRSLLMVQNTFEETEVGNDIIVNANKIPHVTVKDLEFQTMLRFLYGVEFGHVNGCVLGTGSGMRIVSFTEGILQGPRTMHFKNIAEMCLDDLKIGHLQLIGMKCLSKLCIRRCTRLLKPVILEDMMKLEEVEMLDCEYLDDDCSALRIQRCAQLQQVTIIECGKLRPIFVSKVGSSPDFQNLHVEDIEDISNVQVSTPWLGIKWCHNNHVKVNIGWRKNRLDVHSHGGKFGSWIFQLYIMGVVPALDSDVIDFMTDYTLYHADRYSHNYWTCMVLQSKSTLPEGDFINSFDATGERSFKFVPNIALGFCKQEFETRLCFFYGALCEQVLQFGFLDNWRPIKIVSSTGYEFQILNKSDVSLQLGRITELCFNGSKFYPYFYQILSKLRFLSRLNIQNVTSSSIHLDTMIALEYLKLADIKFDHCQTRIHTTLCINHCPRLREVVLDKCINVDYVFKVGYFGSFNSLQKLFIKDCPDLAYIHYPTTENAFPDLKEVQVINCPRLHSFPGIVESPEN